MECSVKEEDLIQDNYIDSKIDLQSKIYYNLLQIVGCTFFHFFFSLIEVEKTTTIDVWIAYACTLTFQPAFLQQDIKDINSVLECRLDLAKKIALTVKDALIGLLFWDLFFITYFDLIRQGIPGNSFDPKMY